MRLTLGLAREARGENWCRVWLFGLLPRPVRVPEHLMIDIEYRVEGFEAVAAPGVKEPTRSRFLAGSAHLTLPPRPHEVGFLSLAHSAVDVDRLVVALPG